MSYQYVDHVADVGLEATGESLEEALCAAGQGLLDLLVDTETVEAASATTISAVASDPAGLLVSFLNAILTERDIRGWFFNSIRIDEVMQAGGTWKVRATLWGEPVDFDRHAVGNEVKAATYSGLVADVTDSGVTLRCVLDI